MNIQDFSNEILLSFFSYCDVQTIGYLAQVNRKFYDLTKDAALWQTVVESRFSLKRTPQQNLSWMGLCQQIVFTIRAAGTLKALEEIAAERDLDIVQLKISHFYTLCKSVAMKNFDPEELRKFYDHEIMKSWRNGDEAYRHPLSYAISENLYKILKVFLEILGTGLNTRTFIPLEKNETLGSILLSISSRGSKFEASDLFKMTLDKMKDKPEFYPTVAQEPIFLNLLDYHRIDDAKQLIDVMGDNIDFIFGQRILGSNQNVFHMVGNLNGPGAGDFCLLLLKRLRSNPQKLRSLLQEKTSPDCGMQTPVDIAEEHNRAIAVYYRENLKR